MKQSAYKQILSLQAVHLMSLYIHGNVEVTVGGKPRYKYKIQCVVLRGVIGWIIEYSYSRRRWRVVIRYVSLAVGHTERIAV